MQFQLLRAVNCTSVLNAKVSNNPLQFRRLFHMGLVNYSSNTAISSLLYKRKQKLICAAVHNFGFKLHNTLKDPNLMIYMLANGLKTFPQCLKNNSVKVVQNCVRNCEYVLAHRMRRFQQMLCLYSKLWEEGSYQLLLNKLYKRLKNQTPLGLFVFCSSLGSSYDWNKERISDEDILRYSAEMSLVEFLKVKRKSCLKGTERPADCKCPVCTATDSEWQSFVEEDNIVVWKREDENHRGKGLFCYKMYSRYGDVTAYDFLEAQIDLEYRRSWDTHAAALRLIDSEPSTNSDVIYWETKWPKMFSNRDYVFKRRYRIDKKRNLIYLVNHSTKHPSCPVLSNKQRVTEYWSYMIIKPTTTFDKPGIEFSLTYFDNPEVNVPSPMTLWVTVTGMPDYLKKLHTAALGVAEYRGGKPSPLATQGNGHLPNGLVTLTKTEQSSSTALLLESLRATLFLF